MLRQTVRVVLAVALLVTAACTGNKTVPPPTVRSTIAPSNSVIVLDVVGLHVATAKHAIKDAGLSWDLSVTTGTYVHAAVLRQDPPPGSVLRPGATVHIVSGPA